MNIKEVINEKKIQRVNINKVRVMQQQPRLTHQQLVALHKIKEKLAIAEGNTNQQVHIIEGERKRD